MQFWEEDSYMREDDRYEYGINYTGFKTDFFDRIKNYLKKFQYKPKH